MPQAAVVELSSLNGANGFRISGHHSADASGYSVNSAGDVNGDGYADIIVSAFNADVGASNTGAAYVVFGRASGFPADLNLAGLDGTNGFRIPGWIANDHTGAWASSAGDVNGDGYDDLAIFSTTGPGGASSGSVFVVFGKAGPFAADVDLAAVNGADGFRLNGIAAADQAGLPVNSAGDVNGDGYDDLIIGAPGHDRHGESSGAAYVVFGKAGGLPANVSLSSLNGQNGFKLNGQAANDFAGRTAACAGDINGDGYDDVIVGAPGADANGLDSGSVFVVFGRAEGFYQNMDLAQMDGRGFRIDGGAAGDDFGLSAASAGDLNGDGYDDLIVGAGRADPNGLNSAGSAYVIFGRPSGFPTVLQAASLDGEDGYRLNGKGADDGAGGRVASAGDVNGDGLDDLIIGAAGANASSLDSGAAYVVFGRAYPRAYVGTAADDRMNGGAEGDLLGGGGGKDVLSGRGGDDVIDGGDGNDALSGGDGADTLVGKAGNDTLDGGAGDDLLSDAAGSNKLIGGGGDDMLIGGTGADRLDGGSGADTLTGGAGNDYLDGGAGADGMSGKAGNDVYIVDDAGDAVAEGADEGYDIVRTDLNWLLGANLEALELQGSGDIEGTGNAGANNIQGNAGANRLDGGGGVDTINGADGDDIIVGGLDNDLLRGGMGADVFAVAHAFGTVLETDQVYDFSAAEGDSLDLSGAYGGTLSLVAGFTKHAGEMTLTFAGGITTLRLDVTGDGKVDYQMKLNGDVTGESGDWLL